MSKDPSRRMSASQIHRELKIPYSYLRQVMSELCRKGFIKGSAGRNGGFLLAKKASEISIAEIIDSGEGLKHLEECIMGFKKCPLKSPCPVHNIWSETRTEILKILSRTPLNEMIVSNTINN
jgi:Rrf2 family protein